MIRARLVDVAARAGVAPNTASTILNNRPNSWASQETKDRVRKAAEELGYIPSRAARGIRLGRFNSVGLVLPDLHNPYYTAMADMLDLALKNEGFDLVIEHSRLTAQGERRSNAAMLQRQIDGAVFFIGDVEAQREMLENLMKQRFPTVAMAARPARPLPVDSIVIDFTQGLREAVDFLYELKHRRMAFLCALAPDQPDGNRPGLFTQLLSEHGIPAADMIFARCGHGIGDARQAFTDLMSSVRPRPTAVIAMNDLSAIGAMRAAIDLGLSVPGDLSVIGVDNIPLGEHLPIALTTIAQPIGDMATRVASLVLDRIRRPRAGRATETVFPTELIVRESTGPARA